MEKNKKILVLEKMVQGSFAFRHTLASLSGTDLGLLQHASRR